MCRNCTEKSIGSSRSMYLLPGNPFSHAVEAYRDSGEARCPKSLQAVPHWGTHEPRNEARYEPWVVYEARQRLVDQYEARTGLVRRDREIRGSYSSQLRASYMPSAPRRSTRLVIGSNTRLASGLSRFFMVDVWPHTAVYGWYAQRLHMSAWMDAVL